MALNIDTNRVLDCGKTLTDLSTYLAHDRLPYDPAIENCAECANALRALQRISSLSRTLIATNAQDLQKPQASWLDGIFSHISTENRAGRDLPLSSFDSSITLAITEGAVRALIRDTGDQIPGLLVGSCRLQGDADTAGAPVRILLTVSVAALAPIPPLIERLRADVYAALRRHTELNLESIDIIVQNLHNIPQKAGSE